MNQKHYIGNRVTSMELYDEIGPVTGVALIVDDENEIFAGDESGYVLEMPCPYATYAMANSMLAKAKGRTYKGYSAENAPLGIGAELGDGVTVGRVYSMLAYQKLSFGSGHLSAIAAPGEKEVDHEFPYQSPLKREVRRNKAQVYSRISKTSEEIRAEIADDINGLSSSVDIKLGTIRQEIQGAEEAISYLEVDLEAISGRVEDAEGNIGALELEAANFGVRLEDAEGNIANLEVSTEEIEAAVGDISVRISELEGLTVTDKTGTTKISGSSVETETLKVKAANIEGVLTVGEQLPSNLATTDQIPDVSEFLTSTDLGENGTTTIYGGLIETDSIYADSMHLGGLLTVYDGEYSNAIGGYIGYDAGFNSEYGIGIRTYVNGNGAQVVCTDEAARISFTVKVLDQITKQTGVTCGSNVLTLEGYSMIQMAINQTVLVDLDEDGLYPADKTMTLGTSDYPWADVHAAGTSMSDLQARVEALEGKSAS